jgi:DNA end-binding protein Ku
MPAAVWSGTISMGLVNVGVQLYPTNQDPGPTLHQFHAEDAGHIRYQRWCEADGEPVAVEDIARGIEAGGDMVMITDQDLESMPEVAKKTIAIEAFVPEEQIDPIQYRRSYYVVPDKNAVRPYALLRDAFRKSGRVAVTRFALRERESLALLRTDENIVVLEDLFWPDEVRAVPFEAPEHVGEGAELDASISLVEAMSGDFDHERYHNHYREELAKIIEAKVEGREVVAAPAEKPAPESNVTSLLEALQASVKAAKAGRESEPSKTRRRARKAG